MLHEIVIAFDVIVARDGELGLTQHRGFEDQVVVRITALVHSAGGYDTGAAPDQQLQEFLDIRGGYRILAGEAWTSQYVGEFIEERQRDNDLITPVARP